jgi:DEAD/DEAH box helicase domain-containing protein
MILFFRSYEREWMKTLVFDLETKKTFDEVGGREFIDKLEMSLGVVYDYTTGEFATYFEADAERLADELLSADLVVGFNLIQFDYVVLQPYTKRDLKEIKTLDLLKWAATVLGFRVSLESFVQATLGAGKMASGLQAVAWYRAGEMKVLEEYCRRDVDLTRQLYEYGKANGRVYFTDKNSGRRKELPVFW